MSIRVEEYVREDGSNPFRVWFDRLDSQVAAKVATALRVPVTEAGRAALALTQNVWVDVVKDCSTNPCGAPDGITDFVDVSAILDKFKNLTGNVIKARADIEPKVPDQLVNITDVAFCLGAFLGQTYPPLGGVRGAAEWVGGA